MGKVTSKSVIVQSNYLIEAQYKLSLQELRLIYYLIAMLKKDDEDFKTYKINLRDFNKWLGVENTAVYTETKAVTKKLLERVLIIQDPEKGRELQIGWVSSAEYIENAGVLEIEFSPKLKPYLLQLTKGYLTKYLADNISRLNSTYSVRIYQLLKQYQKIGERYFKISDLKAKLGITDKYKQYGHFKSRVIMKAQNEIVEHTDITFTFKEKKQGRKVVGIMFFISLNEPKAIEDIENDLGFILIEGELDLYVELQEYFRLNMTQAKSVLQQYKEDPKKILANLSYVKKRRKTIKNIAAYTLDAIKNNYQEEYELFDDHDKEISLANFKSDLQSRYEKNTDQAIANYKRELTDDEIQAIEDAIRTQVANDPSKKKGLKGHQRLAIKDYYKEKLGIPDFEKWSEDQINKFKKEMAIN